MRGYFTRQGRQFFMEECYRCKTPFAMAGEVYYAAQERREGMSFYCPNGHEQHYVSGETEQQKLRRERDRLKQSVAQWRDEAGYNLELAKHHEKSAAAHKGHVTRLKNRAKAGVCPCCNRTFQNLQRHMASKHPDFDPNKNVVKLEPPKKRA